MPSQVAIDFPPQGAPFVFRETGNNVFRASVGHIIDGNSNLLTNNTYTYQWFNADGTAIVGETSQTYDAQGADSPGHVLITLTDQLGFQHGWSVNIGIFPTEITGNLFLNSRLAADLSALNLGAGNYTYEWLIGSPPDNFARSPITGSYFTLNPQNLRTAEYVGLRLTFTPQGGSAMQSPIFYRRINEPPVGQLSIAYPQPLRAGAILSVDVRNITDANDTAASPTQFSDYQWYLDGRALAGTGKTYTLQQTDFDTIVQSAGQSRLSVSLSHTDSLGYQTPLLGELLLALTSQLSVSLNGQDVRAAFTPNSSFELITTTYQWFIGRGSDINQYTRVSTGGNVYTLPAVPDYDKPYLFVRVNYQVLAGGETLTFRQDSDSPLQIAGLASGSAQLVGSGKGNGARYQLQLDNLRNVRGQVPSAGDLSYRWQAVGAGGYTLDLTTGYSNVYVLRGADFAAAQKSAPSLRVVVADRTDISLPSSVNLITQPINISAALRGVLELRSGNYAVGGVFAADISRLSDENGLASVTYQWLQSSGPDSQGREVFLPIRGGVSSQRYTVQTDDLTGGTPKIKLVAEVRDEFGFSERREKEVMFLQAPLQGQVALQVGGYTVDSTVRADVSGLRDANGAGNITYRWLTGDGATFTATRDTGAEYTVQAAHFSSVTMLLRLEMTYIDSIGGIMRQTVEHNMNAPTQGAPAARINGVVQSGSAVTALLGELRDANGFGNSVGNTEVVWMSGTTLVGNGLSYLLKDADINAINANNGGFLMVVTLTDGLGFQEVFTVNVAAAQVNILPYDGRLVGSAIDHNNRGEVFSYVWENSATSVSSGIWVTTPGNRNVLDLPSDYDYSSPYVRLRANKFSVTAYSLPLRVGGVVSGRAAVVAAGAPQSGSAYWAGLGNMRNVLGFVPRAGELSYQWQVASALAGTYTDIADMTSRIYTLRADDVGGAKGGYLRVMVSDATGAGSDYTPPSSDNITGPAVNINSPTEGSVAVSGGSQLAEGLTLSAVVNATDANGEGVYRYQWYWRDREQAGAFSPIPAQISAYYVVKGADFGGSGAPEVAVSVIHIDALGFTQDNSSSFRSFAAYRGAVRAPASGNVYVAPVEITTNGRGNYAPDSVLTVVPNITDANGRGRISSYVLERAQSHLILPEYTVVNTVVNSGVDNNGRIILRSAVWVDAGYDLLRVRATHIDPFGEETEFLTPPLSINRPTEGVASVAVQGGIRGIIENATLTAIVNLTDGNNITLGEARTLRYQWINGEGGEISLATSVTFQVRRQDAQRATEGRYMSVRIEHEDSMGFVHTMVVGLASLAALEQQQVEDIAAVLNVAAAQDAMNVVNLHLSETAGPQRASSPALGFQINGGDVQQWSDLSRALLAQKTATANSTIFDLQNFSMRYRSRGSKGGGDYWSGWVRGAWSDLKGRPLINGRETSYEGDSFSFYGGVDRSYGNSRLGLAAGVNNAKLKVALHSDSLANDKLSRDLNSLLPYFELSGQHGNLRIVGGYGTGLMEVELRDSNDAVTCSGELDMSWYMTGVSGEWRAIDNEVFDLSVEGALNNSTSETSNGQCKDSVRRLPGADNSGGEGLLGLRGGYNARFSANRGLFRPFFLLDGRKLYGDISEKMIFDYGGGILLNAPNGLSFRGELTRQITNAQYERNGFNGVLSYSGRGWQSSYNTVINQNATGDFVLNHRWEMQSAAARAWADSVRIKLYAEHAQDGDNAVGAQLQADF